jgi:hypothetical protein
VAARQRIPSVPARHALQVHSLQPTRNSKGDQVNKKQDPVNVPLIGQGAFAGEALIGTFEKDEGDQVMVRIPSGLGIYFWNYGKDDPETGNQVAGGATGYKALLHPETQRMGA